MCRSKGGYGERVPRCHDTGSYHDHAEEKGTTLPEFEAFWEAGYVENPPPPKPVMLAALRANPEANPLKTPSGKIEIYSETIASFCYDDCPGHPAWLEPAEWLGSPLAKCYPLHLISNQPPLHATAQPTGQQRNQLESKIKGREPVTMHPEDAAARGLRARACAQMGGEGLCGDRDGLCFCSRKAGHKGPHHGDSIRVEWCALGGNEDSVWY